ncbi:A24 family peptidase [Pseudarthrobacter sp. J64]|uniref:A24 family peptidase n=1 Tax=Pseudarthrobacter sp. J64 TaxID=3116485 RepID=UPI002E7FFFBD|nr:A24 family peptidase [Pseudarthrobacter sp. J64]MEE2570911.1 A24 family peptidase [Pseudarthrobacter sp. J64]
MSGRLGELWGTSPVVFWLVLAACAFFVVMAVRLAVIDIREHRLPNRIIFPAYPAVAVLLLAAAVVHHLDGEALSLMPDGGAALFGIPGGRIVAGGAVLWIFYFLLRLIYPPGMGFGDVKLAGILGMYLGYLGWSHLAFATFGAFLLGGLWGVALILARRGTLKSAIPFGPFMLLGAGAAMLLP